jgi:SWI/SNF-related matrix-associated actin-dependent regulator of chromatin subfamily A3
MELTLNLFSAHDIRAGSQVTAKAVGALQANRRWAISGTPIQNRVEDLASLYHFLRAYPYDDPKVFREHVRGFGRLERNEAMQRLRNLVCSIMLRRSIGTTVDLPPRKDTLHRLDFSSEERMLYTKIESIAMGTPDVTQTQQPNALVCINNLRQVCNLGLLAQIRTQSSELTAWNQKNAQDAFNSLIAMGSAICNICNVNLETVGTEVTDRTFASSPPRLYSCLTLICGRCCENTDNSCVHRASHASAAITTLSSSVTATDTAEHMDRTRLPTKIQCVLQDLEIHTPTEKWLSLRFGIPCSRLNTDRSKYCLLVLDDNLGFDRTSPSRSRHRFHPLRWKRDRCTPCQSTQKFPRTSKRARCTAHDVLWRCRVSLS